MATYNRNDKALMEVGGKADDISKTIQNAREIINVALDGSHEHYCIVCV